MLTTIAQQGAAAAAPAYASSESGASSHRSSLDLEIDAAGARFTPWSTFEDAVEEKEYRGVLRVPFLRAVIKLAVVGLFLESISFVVALFSRTHPINLAMSGTFLTLHAFALVISLFARKVQQFPLAAVELLVTAWLCASAVRTIFFAPSRLARLTGADVAVGVDGFSSLFVRAYAVVFAGGLFVPLELRHFGVVLFVVVASLATGEVVMPVRADNAALRSDAFVQVALASMALFAVHKRCRNERGQFHFRRALLARVLEWRDTKRSEMEAKARASSAEVAASARAKLIRVVMHDLRSPLLAVRATAQLMMSSEGNSAFDTRMPATVLNTCTELMENIISDMLDFERIDSGRLVLMYAPFTVQDLISDALTCYEPMASQRGVTLAADPLLLPLGAETYMGDKRRLLQCLGNGVSNALKFSEAGQTVRIRAVLDEIAPSSHSRTDVVRVCVTDEGQGISESELQVLERGEAFSQVGRGQLQGNGGTGLGLNIARSILSLHGGSRLHLRSEGHGHGTTFEMELLLKRARAGAPASASAEAVEEDRGEEADPRARAAAHTRVQRARIELSEKENSGDLRMVPLRVSQDIGAQCSFGARSSASVGSHSSRGDGSSRGSGPAHGGAEARGPGLMSGLAAAITGGPTLMSPRGRRVLPMAAPPEDAALAPAPHGMPSPVRTRELPPVQAKPHAAPNPRVGPVRCLHVEDDGMLRLALGARLFTREGVACDAAEDGQAALDLFAAREAAGEPRYELVLMDNQMPTLRGEEATRILRSKGFTDAIIGMTGDPLGSEDRSSFMASGLDMCVDKTPEGMQIVEREIERLLALRDDAHAESEHGSTVGIRY